MKLPEDKSERIKLFVVIGLFGAGLLYLLISSAITPMLRKKKEQHNEIEKLTREIQTAQRMMDLVDGSRKMNIEVVNEILQISETNNCILKPRLGNYLLEATDIIERLAQQAGIPLVSVTEAGITPAPVPGNSSAAGAFNIYTARVTVQCGLHDLARLIEKTEGSNPYLCISGIIIKGNPATPAAHNVAFDVQWPIWKEEGTLEIIRQSAETDGDKK